MLRLATALLACTALAPSAALACIHGSTPEGKPYKGKILSKGYEGIVLHAEGREELILNVTASFKGDPKGVGALGWVLALPVVPDRYDASLTPEVFRDASEHMHSLITPPPARSRNAGPAEFSDGGGHQKAAPQIRVKKIRVGPYTIHQIEVLGDKAVGALNRWFSTNGFATKDPKEMSFFVERRYTFLCLRVEPGKEQTKGFGRSTLLAPLRVSFKSARPFFPLKFSSHAGTFPLSLYLLTAEPLDWEASGASLQRLGLEAPLRFATPRRQNHDVSRSGLPGMLGQAYRKALKEGFPKGKRFFFNHLQAPKVNRGKRPISKWTDDLWLELNSASKRSEVRAVIRQMMHRREIGSDHLDALSPLGDEARAPLQEVLVTSTKESARICAAWLLLKLGLSDANLAGTLQSEKPSPGLASLLAAIQLHGGDKAGFKPLLKAAKAREGKSALRWLKGKPGLNALAHAILSRYTGLQFRTTNEWEQWHGEYRSRLRFDREQRRFLVR
jgi:uncharacterized protein DUF2330